jgi:hypothetical protein
METTINNTVTTVKNQKASDWRNDVLGTNARFKEMMQDFRELRELYKVKSERLKVNPNFAALLLLTEGFEPLNNLAYKIVTETIKYNKAGGVGNFQLVAALHGVVNAKVGGKFVDFSNTTVEELTILKQRVDEKIEKRKEKARENAEAKAKELENQKRNTATAEAKTKELENRIVLLRSKLATAHKAMQTAENALKRANTDKAKTEAQDKANVATATAHEYSMKLLEAKEYLETFAAVKGGIVSQELLDSVTFFLTGEAPKKQELQEADK